MKRARAVSRAELGTVLAAAVKRHRVPGAAAAVLIGERSVEAYAGVTSVENPLPVDGKTLFMIGSTTKTVTATALMRLVEAGKAALDDPVTRHLPKFRLKDAAATRALTLRHLVTHTGGWDGDIATETGWGDDALERYVALLKAQPQLVPVGAVWSYNNAGFCVLGRVIEVLTGTTYEQAVHDLVLAPLQMRSSFLSPIDAMSRRFAIGHFSDSRRASVAHMWGLTRALGPAGGVISTPGDQLKYARFHLGDGRGPDGKRLLKAATMRLMQRDLVPAGTIADSVGISWLIRDIGGARTVGHGGNVSNLAVSTFLMVPGSDMAVTVLTNAGAGRRVADEVEAWVLQRCLGIRDDLPSLIETDPAGLATYAGLYRANLTDLEVSRRGRGLAVTTRYNINLEEVPEEEREAVRKIVEAPPKSEMLSFYAPDRAVVTSGPARGSRAEFLRPKQGGAVTWMRWGGRLLSRA